MSLVNMKNMLNHAYENGYAIGAFDLVNLDFLQGIIDAAERTQSPIILSLAESHFDFFDFELLMPAVEKAAIKSSVPIAIHLDHGSNFEIAVKAISSGCNGIMIDTSNFPLSDNIEITRSVVSMAHACGVPVEGELGYVPGVEGEDARLHPGDIKYTTVSEAVEYVRNTGIDFLAVSIGTVHGHMQGKPSLDFQRLQAINEALRIPLVIHGGTGLENEQFKQLIRHGVCKINYYTALSDAAAKQIRHNASHSQSLSYFNMVKGISDVISAEVERCLHLWGSAGKAAQLLEICEPWLSVEHLIVFNVEKAHEPKVEDMMQKGRNILSTIPGVREVLTGTSMNSGDLYRYTWLVRFCHPNVINSYRVHPAHVSFADNLFRPVAGDRISIDYSIEQ
ncbi:MAG: ketose-bisphosphate aldolase [Gammaproteobacteria bacterium]|nr:ketose-bisphosphate aldolase [Gammaproteobacteria bacterium]